MKLELKHLAPYLAYGLNLDAYYDSPESRIVKMVAIDSEEHFYSSKQEEPTAYISGIDEKQNMRGNYGFLDIKPILRPLSDLTKEIEVNEKNFVPAEYFWSVDLYDIQAFELYGTIPEYWKACLALDVRDFDFGVVEKLFEWHFDVFGLIEAGLAIDINTLKK